MTQKSWSQASKRVFRVRPGMRNSHDSQYGTQGEGAPLTSYLRDGFLLLPQRLDSLIVLQRSGATGESLSCTEYENLGRFLPLLTGTGALFPH